MEDIYTGLGGNRRNGNLCIVHVHAAKVSVAAIYSLQLLYTVVVSSTFNVLSLLIHVHFCIDPNSTEFRSCLVRLLDMPRKAAGRHQMYHWDEQAMLIIRQLFQSPSVFYV
jgi:hypothetical protein